MWCPWNVFPGCTSAWDPQVWCPQNVFPGCTSAPGSQVWCSQNVFPGFPSALGSPGVVSSECLPRMPRWAVACRCALEGLPPIGCTTDLHNGSREMLPLCRFSSINCSWKSTHTHRQILFLSHCEKNGPHVVGGDSILVAHPLVATWAPCPSTPPTMKWFITCGSACVFPSASRPQEWRCSQGCPVSLHHSPSPTPALSSKNWFCRVNGYLRVSCTIRMGA